MGRKGHCNINTLKEDESCFGQAIFRVCNTTREPFRSIVDPGQGRGSSYCRNSGMCMSGEMLKGEENIFWENATAQLFCKLCRNTTAVY